MIELTILLSLGLALVAVILVARLSEARTASRRMVCLRLDFPRQAEPAQVQAALEVVLALPRPRRPWQVHGLVAELLADDTGLHHRVCVMPEQVEAVTSHLLGLPGIRVKPDDTASLPLTGPAVAAAELGLTSSRRPLRVPDPAATATALLAAAQPLRPGEQICVLWCLAPVTGQLTGSAPWSRQQSEQDDRAWAEKQKHPLIVASLRVGAAASTSQRAKSLVARQIAPLSAVAAPGARLIRRRWPQGWIVRAIQQRLLPVLPPPFLLNLREASSLVLWPMGGLLPGLVFANARQRPAAASIPVAGRGLLRSDHPATLGRMLALSPTAATMHTVLYGQTGSGKSVSLTAQACDELAVPGRAVIFIDPRADAAEAVIDRLPASRVNDLVYLNAADKERPVGFNPLALGRNGTPDQVADRMVSVMKAASAPSWGPRLENVARYSCLLLAEHNLSVAELVPLLQNPAWRRPLVAGLTDQFARTFWLSLEALSAQEQAAVVAPVLTRAHAWLSKPGLRRIVGQTESAIDFDDVLANGKVVIVSLVKEALGEQSAVLLGGALVSSLWAAIQRRSLLPPDQRPMVAIFVDEAHVFLTGLGAGVDDALALSRGWGASWTLAHQSLSSFSPEVRAAEATNCRTKIVLGASAADARLLAQELGIDVSAEEIQSLSQYQGLARIATDSGIAPPVTGTTVLPPAPTGYGQRAREQARQRFGRPAAEIDAELVRRHRAQVSDGPIGWEARS